MGSSINNRILGELKTMINREFERLRNHVGHKVSVVLYGKPPVNVAIECEICHEILYDIDKEEESEEK